MRIELLSLAELRERISSLEKEQFVAQYPGIFLMAMGLLAVQVMTGRGPGTIAMSFGARLRHEVGQAHPLAGLTFFLRSDKGPPSAVLGRSPDCDLTIPDPSVSERHCRLQVTERGVEAVDLGSTNGTSINLTRLKTDEGALLGDEDMLTLGRYSFQVLSSATFFAAMRLLEAMEKLPQ
jgi:hypothetical protein